MNSFLNDNAIKGTIAFSKAEIRALSKGYIVSKPSTDCCRYDMIIDDGVDLIRIQVKYAGGKNSNSTGNTVVNLRKEYKNGKSKNGYTKEEVDAIVLYIPQIDEVCYFPIEMLEGKKTLTIRYEKAKNNQVKNVIYAKDFIW